MKSWLILLMLVISSATRGAETNTHPLSIHLLADKPAWRGAINLSNLKLATEPVITDADIMAYDVTNHMFAISAEAANRLAKAVWQASGETPKVRTNGEYEFLPFDTPFVACSFGERLCLGWFYSFSATVYFNAPTIRPGPGSFLINSDATTNVWLKLDCPLPLSESSENAPKTAVEVFRSARRANESLSSSNKVRFFFDNSAFTNQSIRIR